MTAKPICSTKNITACFEKNEDAQAYVKELLSTDQVVGSVSVYKQRVMTLAGRYAYPTQWYWQVSYSATEGGSVQDHFQITAETPYEAQKYDQYSGQYNTQIVYPGKGHPNQLTGNLNVQGTLNVKAAQ